MYKSQEEKKYIDIILKSGLINREQIAYIKNLYNESVPYHNFLHALTIAEGVLHLSLTDFNITEIKSLFIAALFHDAGHKGSINILDEFHSLDLAFQGILEFEKKYNYSGIDYSIIRKAIIGTVFKNRAKNTDIYALILADLDVSMIGKSLLEFLYYCDFPISIEFGENIQTWKNNISYFKFLFSCNRQIFRTSEIKNLYPNALKNIKKYLQLDNNIYIKLFEYYNSRDISFEEFKIFAKDSGFFGENKNLL